jgi:hypothetical protein
LKAWRVEPETQISSRLILPNSTSDVIACKAGSEQLGLLAQLRCILGQPLCECRCLLETTPLLHALFFPIGGRRERCSGVLITDKCHGPLGGEVNLRGAGP